MIDIWSATGVRLPRQMSKNDRIPAPEDEISFLAMKPGGTPSPISNLTSSASCLWAQMIPLADLFGEIHDLNDRVVREPMDSTLLQETVSNISAKLDTWLIRLPAALQSTSTNLQRFAAKGFGRTFVALHLGYHHYCQLLYYQFLHDDCHDLYVMAKPWAQRCKDHATALSRLLAEAFDTPGCECLYIMVGHILVIGSSVQLHTLLFGTDATQISQARTILEHNFEMLMRLRAYWPSLDVSMARLRSFHNACRASMETSFRMDQWMLRFLLQHGSSLSEKEIGVIPTSHTAVEGLSPQQTSPGSFQTWYRDTIGHKTI